MNTEEKKQKIKNIQEKFQLLLTKKMLEITLKLKDKADKIENWTTKHY